MMSSDTRDSGSTLEHDTDIDSVRLEVLEHRLTNRLRDSVEKALLFRYGLVLAALTVAFGVTGYSIKTAIDNKIEETVARAERTIDQKVDTKIAEIEEEVVDAKEKSREIELTQALAERIIGDTEKRITGFDEKARLLERFRLEVDAVLEELEGIKGQAERAKLIFADSGQLIDLGQRVALAEERLAQLERLGRELDPSAVMALPSVDQMEAARQQVVEQYREDRPKTVFFQFAILPRSQAQQIAAALAAKGYLIPSEDREDAATALREVRYFYSADEDPATELARQTEKVLADLGWSGVTIGVSDLTAYRGPKPRPGVLELWLGLPPSARAL
jgi:flavin-binding protein dodecin